MIILVEHPDLITRTYHRPPGQPVRSIMQTIEERFAIPVESQRLFIRGPPELGPLNPRLCLLDYGIGHPPFNAAILILRVEEDRRQR
jgi:hypothetical protein